MRRRIRCIVGVQFGSFERWDRDDQVDHFDRRVIEEYRVRREVELDKDRFK